MGKKIKYEKSSAILIFLAHTVMIRFSALSAYLLLIPKGWRFFETGRYYGTRQLFNFLRTGKLFQTNLWCLFEKDQEDCWTDMLSLDLSWPERIAKKSSSQNLKAWSFVWRNCTHIRITYNIIYMHAHLYEISTEGTVHTSELLIIISTCMRISTKYQLQLLKIMSFFWKGV